MFAVSDRRYAFAIFDGVLNDELYDSQRARDMDNGKDVCCSLTLTCYERGSGRRSLSTLEHSLAQSTIIETDNAILLIW
jgi:hypothetical protein